MIKPSVLCAILLFLIQAKLSSAKGRQDSLLVITNITGKVINNLTLHYPDITSVTYTCEHKLRGNYSLIWKQVKDNLTILFPHRQVKTYSITIDLERYDDAYNWCCAVYYKLHYYTACFRTKVEPPNVHEEILLSTKHENCWDSGYSGTVYSLKSTNTKAMLNWRKICITMVTKYITPTELKLNRYVFKYRSGPENDKSDLLGITENYRKSISTTTDKTEPANSDTMQDGGKLWKIGIGAGVMLLIVIVAIIIIIRRKHKRNTQAPEEIYASPHDVVYADLQMQANSAELPPSNDVAYARVIGVLKKQTKRRK